MTLRDLALAAIDGPESLFADPGDIRMSGIPSLTSFGDVARLHNAMTPSVVLALLDVVEEARGALEAAELDPEFPGDFPALRAALARYEEVSRAG